ncbi:MAG: winged helix-turn-helix transcriptional regulator [Bradyrhizobiaceae bacterium]|nr:winged helix-turn-helix transcriptional regulator [Bradyrhizobiaceae bacterium]
MDRSADPPPEARAIAELVDRLGRVVRAGEHQGGLNPAQWEALRYLARCNRFSNTPGALARYLAATKGTVSQTLNALERKGLIERRPDPASGRVVRLLLTRAGRALAAKDPLIQLATAAAGCDRRVRAAAADVLADMLAALQRANGLVPFGVCRTCRHFRPHAPNGAPHWCALLDERLSEADSRSICVEHSPLAA